MTEVCIKSDGQNGTAIINYLTGMGGINVYQWKGKDAGAFYWIDHENNIRVSGTMPEGKKPIVLPKEV
jgi:hypothetical protein